MIPLRDTVKAKTFALVNVTLVLLDVLVFWQELVQGPRLERLLHAYGLIPARLVAWPGLPLDPSRFLPLFTSLFFHGGWLHLLGNLLYLWIFGSKIEDRLGHARYLAFYLLCGVLAGLAQVTADPLSQVPTVGASGAIAGVLGAYLVSYPRAKVLTFVPLFFLPWLVEVPAVVYLLLWFAVQVLAGMAELGARTGGVAWWAHAGGFVAGALLVLVVAPGRRRQRRR